MADPSGVENESWFQRALIPGAIFGAAAIGLSLPTWLFQKRVAYQPDYITQIFSDWSGQTLTAAAAKLPTIIEGILNHYLFNPFEWGAIWWLVLIGFAASGRRALKPVPLYLMCAVIAAPVMFCPTAALWVYPWEALSKVTLPRIALHSIGPGLLLCAWLSSRWLDDHDARID